MLHQPVGQFQTIPQPSVSRVALLANTYQRWHELYNQGGELEDRLSESGGDEEEIKRLRNAQVLAAMKMHEAMDQLIMTPCRTLVDFGLKSRVIREFQGDDWYRRDADLDRGEQMARALVIELMEINDLAPMPERTLTFSEVLPEYIEQTPAIPLPQPVAVMVEPEQPGCPVAQMGHRFARLIKQHDALESGHAAEKPWEKKRRYEYLDITAAMIESIKEQAPMEDARSPEGALFQVILAANHSDGIHDCIVEGSENERAANIFAMRAEAALKSVRKFLEAHFGLDGRNFGGNYCMSEDASLVKKMEVRAAQLTVGART